MVKVNINNMDFLPRRLFLESGYAVRQATSVAKRHPESVYTILFL